MNEQALDYKMQGFAMMGIEKFDKAVDAFSKALLLDPNNGEILFNIGCVYLLQERLKKCIEYYNYSEVKIIGAGSDAYGMSYGEKS